MATRNGKVRDRSLTPSTQESKIPQEKARNESKESSLPRYLRPNVSSILDDFANHEAEIIQQVNKTLFSLPIAICILFFFFFV